MWSGAVAVSAHSLTIMEPGHRIWDPVSWALEPEKPRPPTLYMWRGAVAVSAQSLTIMAPMGPWAIFGRGAGGAQVNNLD